MIIKDNTIASQHVNIKRSDGKILGYIKTFDTETKEAEVYVNLQYNGTFNNIATFAPDGKLVTAKVHLFGHDVYFKGTDVIVTEKELHERGFKRSDKYPLVTFGTMSSKQGHSGELPKENNPVE